jgi:hypothetical protein
LYLLDHLVSAAEQRRWHGEAESARSRQIYCKYERCVSYWGLWREFGGPSRGGWPDSTHATDAYAVAAYRIRRWSPDMVRERLEVLHDCGEVELVASPPPPSKSPQEAPPVTNPEPQPAE